MNGTPLHVSDRSFENGILLTALSLYRKEYAKSCNVVIMDAYFQCNDVRRYGSCALELCYLACGWYDLYFEYRVMPWDYAAAYLILTEAGGVLTARDGAPLHFDQPALLIGANHRDNHHRLAQIVSTHTHEPLYEQACREQTLQQERDKTDSIYVAVIAFLVPFVFSREADFSDKSFMGWMLDHLPHHRADAKHQSRQVFKESDPDPFLPMLEFKWYGYVRQEGKKKARIRYPKLVAKTLVSAEFMMFSSIALVSSALTAFGFSLVWNPLFPGFYVLLGCLAFLGLCWVYFRSLASVFKVLADGKKSSFDKAFGKAWFLHIYPMEASNSSPEAQKTS